MSYWVLLVLASRLYPRECMSNSRQCKGDFSARQVSFHQVGCVSLGRDWITQGDRRTERGPRPASSTFSPTIFKQRGKWYLGNTDLIKTPMRCHLRPARRAITKKFTNNQCWRGCRNKGALLHCWWNVNGHSHCGEQCGGSLKTKNRATVRPCNPTPWLISRERHDLKGYMHPNIHCSTAYTEQDKEAT